MEVATDQVWEVSEEDVEFLKLYVELVELLQKLYPEEDLFLPLQAGNP